MRGTVVVALEVDIAVGMELRLFPFCAVNISDRQRLERGLLDRLEALASGDGKARVTAIIDAFDALGERLVDLRYGGKPPAPIPEAPPVTTNVFCCAFNVLYPSVV